MASAATVRVKRGARWLDENFPGWEKRINLKTLNLTDGNRCICGQVFKKKAKKHGWAEGYEYAEENLFSEANAWINGIVKMRTQSQGPSDDDVDRRTERVAVALGFQSGSLFSEWDEDASEDDTPSSDFESVFFSELQGAWEKLLSKRVPVKA